MMTTEERRARNTELKRQFRAANPERVRLINNRADKKRRNTPERKQQLREADKRRKNKNRTGQSPGRRRIFTPDEWKAKELIRCREKNRKFRVENRELYLKRARERQAKLRQTLEGSLHQRMSCAVYYGIRKNKQGRTWTKLLGFSVTDLKMHLESQFREGMTWKLLMEGEIEIDHIFPRCALPHSSPGDENFKRLWALSNLRPLWWWENRAKISADVALKKRLIALGELKLPITTAVTQSLTPPRLS